MERVRFSRAIPGPARRQIKELLSSLPLALSRPLWVDARPDLSYFARRLESGTGRGAQIHAASSIPRRRLLLDAALMVHPANLRRIFVHEMFHFAWTRLGNPRRWSWERLLVEEMEARGRGELGWSSEWRKLRLARRDWRNRSRRWREYACESFCDTAANVFAKAGRHSEFTLGGRWTRRRLRWFHELTSGYAPPV